MQLRVFQASSGDCVLLSSAAGDRILVDGGFKGTFTKHVRPNLAPPVGDNRIDLLCVSHIDSDHISGALQYLDDMLDWRVFRHHAGSPDSNITQPSFPEPPRVGEIWYNGFRDQVDDTTEVEDMLIFSMRAFGTVAHLVPHALEMQFLATSVKQGLELTARVSPEQLHIPHNPDFAGRPILVTDPIVRRQIGSLNVSVIGPFKEDLENLRTEWNEWVGDNRDEIEKLHRKAEEDQARLQLEEGEALIGVLSRFALDAQERGSVTAPNLASIVLLVEEGNQTALLTGDARDDEILAGLEAANRLDSEDRLHVDILKLQHHGSINNVHREFCKAVTADHYVISGGSGGNHLNPDIEVLRFMVESRVGTASQRSTHPSAAQPCTFTFSTNAVDGTDSANDHMQDVVDFMTEAAADHPGQIAVRFMPPGASFLDVQP